MIRWFDYRPGYRRRKAEIDAAIARVLASGQLILGDEVRAFERELAAFVGRPHAVVVSNGKLIGFYLPVEKSFSSLDPNRPIQLWGD